MQISISGMEDIPHAQAKVCTHLVDIGKGFCQSRSRYRTIHLKISGADPRHGAKCAFASKPDPFAFFNSLANLQMANS